MSLNLVEMVRRHHEQGAPSALEVLKEAIDRRGEIADDDRRLAPERSGFRSRQGRIEITAQVTDRIERGRVFTTALAGAGGS